MLAVFVRRQVKGCSLFFSTALYCLAGTITGTLFTVRVLLVLAAFVSAQAFFFACAGNPAAAIASVVGLIAGQVGYLGGVCARIAIENRLVRRLEIP